MKAHRHLGTTALLLAGLLLGALPLRRAHAEIIDFDPETDEVPEVVSAADRARLDGFLNVDFPGLAGRMSPDGGHALAYGPEGLMLKRLTTGEATALPSDQPGLRNEGGFSSEVLASGWQAPHGLVLLASETEGEGDTAVTKVYRLVVDAETLAVTGAAIADFAERTDGVVSFSPDLSRVLVQRRKGGGTLSNPVVVTLGNPDLSPRRPGVPDDLPGRVGEGPLGTIALQQVATELLVVDLTGLANPRALTLALPEDTGLAGISWSQDSAKVAVGTRTMVDWDGDRQRDNSPPGTGLPNQASINVQEALGQLKPADNPLLTGSLIHVARADTGATVGQLKGVDYQQGLLAGLDFAPNGEQALLTIATRSDLEGRPNPTYAYPGGLELWLLDGALAPVRKIAAPGWDSLGAAVAFADDGTLVAVVPAETASHVQAFDLGTGEVRPVWQPNGAIYQVQASAGRLAMVYTRASHAYELYTQRLDEPMPTQLSMVNAAKAQNGLRFETVRWTSSKGQAMEGTYIHHAAQPFPPTKPGPVVVWQQGGPGGQMTNDWGGSVEGPYSMLPGFGIPVFMVNAVGRTVKSPQFFTDMAEGRNFGQLDIEQVKEGVEALIGQKVVDPARVGITGCSYGGYFTLQSIRTYPSFYAAANPQCSLTDLLEEFTMGYTPFISYLMGRSPLADPEEYLKDSPMYGSKDVTTPTLIFHGAEDFLPVPLINNIHDQLAQNGTPVTFLRVKGEGHGFRQPASQAYAGQLQLDWFRRHLKVEPFTPHTVFLPNLSR